MLDMKTFYKWGSILMVIAFLGNLWNLINIWEGLTYGARIANIAGSLAFNLLLAIVFFSMWKMMPNPAEDTMPIISDPDLDAIIKKYQNMPEKEVKPKDKRVLTF